MSSDETILITEAAFRLAVEVGHFVSDRNVMSAANRLGLLTHDQFGRCALTQDNFALLKSSYIQTGRFCLPTEPALTGDTT